MKYVRILMKNYHTTSSTSGRGNLINKKMYFYNNIYIVLISYRTCVHLMDMKV